MKVSILKYPTENDLLWVKQCTRKSKALWCIGKEGTIMNKYKEYLEKGELFDE